MSVLHIENGLKIKLTLIDLLKKKEKRSGSDIFVLYGEDIGRKANGIW